MSPSLPYSSKPINLSDPTPICTQVLNNLPSGYLTIPVTPQYYNFVITFLVIFEMYWFISCLIFWYLSRTWARLRNRNIWLVFLQSLALPIPLIVGPLRDVIGRDQFNCTAVLWTRLGYSTLLGIGLAARQVNINIQVHLHHQIAKVTLDSLDTVRKQQKQDYGNDEGLIHLTKSLTKGISNRNVVAVESEDVIQLRQMLRKSGTWYQFRILASMVVPTIIMLALLTALEPQYSNSCYGCQLRWWEYVLTIACISLTLPHGILSNLKSDTSADPFGIYRELHVAQVVSAIVGTPGLILLVFDGYIGLNATGAFNGEWLVFFGASALHFYAVPYQIYLTLRYRLEHQDEQQALLINTLQTDKREAFLRHCVHELCSELVRFYDEVNKFKMGSGPLTNKEKRLWAIKIWECYISNGAILQINIGERERDKLAKILHITHRNRIAQFIPSRMGGRGRQSRTTTGGGGDGKYSDDGGGGGSGSGRVSEDNVMNTNNPKQIVSATMMTAVGETNNNNNNNASAPTIVDENEDLDIHIFDSAVEETLKMLRDPFARFLKTSEGKSLITSLLPSTNSFSLGGGSSSSNNNRSPLTNLSMRFKNAIGGGGKSTGTATVNNDTNQV
jgi:hypothetical protein